MKRLLFVGLLSIAFVSCKPDLKPSKEYPAPTLFTLPTKNFFPPPAIPTDNPLTVEGIALGRHLFYETKLSGDNTQSCASCHNQEFAFTDNGKRFSTGITGAMGSRNSMALFNLVYSPINNRFFWDGRVTTLREQVLLPIEDPIEMHESLQNAIFKLEQTALYPELFGKAYGDEAITTERMAKALEQFILSIQSGDSKFDRWRISTEQLTPAENRGFMLFMREFSPPGSGRPAGGDCFHCHGNILFTNNIFANNGLDQNPSVGLSIATNDPNDIGKFKTPSLRNIAVSGPYMHDGRFATLEEVLEHYNSHVKDSPTLDVNLKSQGIGLGLTAQDKADIIAFLHTLTDSVYLNNPAYKSPF